MYDLMVRQLVEVSEGSRVPLSMLSNCASLIFLTMDRLNWVGFYLVKNQTLYLGPFQGKPACTVIPFGKGVCGTAAASQQIQRVEDVHAFPGHIACDAASASELVIPLIMHGKCIGVLDLDSPECGRFCEDDAKCLQKVMDTLLESCDFSSGLL